MVSATPAIWVNIRDNREDTSVEWLESFLPRLPISTPGHWPEDISVPVSIGGSVWYLAGDCWLSRHVTDDVTTLWQHRDTLPEASGLVTTDYQGPEEAWSGEYQLNHPRVLITVDNRCGAGMMRNLKSSNFPLNCFHNNREKSLSFVLPRIAICSIWTFCVRCPWQYTKYKICTTYKL